MTQQPTSETDDNSSESVITQIGSDDLYLRSDPRSAKRITRSMPINKTSGTSTTYLEALAIRRRPRVSQGRLSMPATCTTDT